MPKRSAEIGQIQRTFLDPTGTHLIITTTLGENYALNYQSTKAKALGRLKGLHITSIAWNPAHPTRSTGEILLGTANGIIYETYIEPSDEYFKREDRYLRQVWKSPTGDAIKGLSVSVGKDSSTRKVIATTSSGRIFYWQGKVSAHSTQDAIPVYPKFFEREEPVVEIFDAQPESTLAVIPKPSKPSKNYTPIFAWLTGIGVMHGKIPTVSSASQAKEAIFKESDLFLSTELDPMDSQALKSLVLTDYHIVLLAGNSIYAINRLNNQVVFRETMRGEPIIGLCADTINSTYWAYTSDNIYEIVVDNEDREIWKTLLENKEYEEALRLTRDVYSRDTALIAYGDHCLTELKDYTKAAQLLGASSKPFEAVALAFIDAKEYGALQIYLTTKLKTLNKGAPMQRTLVASWIIELYMEKLNSLEDVVAAKGQQHQVPNGDGAATNEYHPVDQSKELQTVVKSFQDFVTANSADLDKSIVYEIISSHSRRDELLFYANSVNDRQFVLNYWIRLERWTEALHAIQAENDPRLYYKYSTVLMANAPKATVDTWMRNPDLDPTKFIAAILTYMKGYRPAAEAAEAANGMAPNEPNQAIRYLKFCINNLKNTDAIIHNTLIAFYASNTTMDEAPLVSFLEEHGGSGDDGQEVYYDTDFALRLCTTYKRVQSSVHIYSSLGQYEEAIRIALEHDNTELAGLVADRVVDGPGAVATSGGDGATATTTLTAAQAQRKELWLEIAGHVIRTKRSGWFKATASILSKCELLKIEDLLPLFPDFTQIDDFKADIVASMEQYNRSINQLNKEMDESVVLAGAIRGEIEKHERGYALVEPGEQCFLCYFPLATRKFYVFPCQHTFHCDCLLEVVLKSSDYRLISEIRRIRAQSAQVVAAAAAATTANSGASTPRGGVSATTAAAAAKEEMAKKIDAALLHSCVLCSDARIDSVDNPLVSTLDTRSQAGEWAL